MPVAGAIPIAITDLPLVVDLSGFAPAGISNAIVKVAHLARTHLVTSAQRELNTSARDYVKGIKPVELKQEGGKFVAILALHGSLANMVEHGRDAWDLRTTVLGPSNAKRRSSKAGFVYAFIPFRHMNEKATGKNAPAVGSAYTKANQPASSRAYRGDMTQAKARVMGRAVWKAQKKLSPTTSSPGGGVSYGEQLGAGVGGAGLLRPRHVSDVYAGMYREQKTYQKDTQSQGVSFRAISTNPGSFREDDAGGAMERNWMHPGIEARHLLPKTQDYLNTLMQAGVFG